MDPKKAEKKRLKKIRKKNKRIYKRINLLAFLFAFATYYLFYRTSISFSMLLYIILFGGIIGTYFEYKRYFFTYKLTGWVGYIGVFFSSSFVLGTCMTMLFLASNYYLSDSSTKFDEYEIIERRSKSGRKYHRSERKPVFTISINGKEKEFEYSHEYYKDMDAYKSISLETAKGLWGFTIIKSRTIHK